MTWLELMEYKREDIQNSLDSGKSHEKRNKSGQFATPQNLAVDILEYSKTLFPDDTNVRFLEPAFGTGSFYSGLLQVFSLSHISEAAGYEIDPDYGNEAIKLWSKTGLKLNISDFTKVLPPASETSKFNLLICNPPYVRHHHLISQEKTRLQKLSHEITGIKLSKLSGLYCYFLFISHWWVSENSLSAWLIPNEFMDVNYGQQVREYLTNSVSLLRIHRFEPDDLQFNDALVSSVVIWFKKKIPSDTHTVEFTCGSNLKRPKVTRYISIDTLRNSAKWSRFSHETDKIEINIKQSKLSDLFMIKRGIVTGANDFFLLTPEQIAEYELPDEFLRPVLPGPRYLSDDEVMADDSGRPVLKHELFLLNCNLPESQIKIKYPALWKYLQTGIEKKINERYICRHRSPWYSQEKRQPVRFLCTYMNRQNSSNKRVFRFILNHSNAIAANVYLLLYPVPVLEQAINKDPLLIKFIWNYLKGISSHSLTREGRVYGGGLFKIEPGELGNTVIDNIHTILPDLFDRGAKQTLLF
jgi:hypothetical protein